MESKKNLNFNLNVRVTKEDYAKAAIYAESQNRTISIYIRDLLKRLANKVEK